MLTQNRLRSVLHYNRETGIFTWISGARKGKVASTRHDARGDLKVAIDGERHYLHRLSSLWMTGAMPRWNIQHVDGNRSNNRWTNLFEGARGQKSAYRAPWREPTEIWDVFAVGGDFEATLTLDGLILNLGTYTTATEAQNVVTVTCRRALEEKKQSLRKAA